MRDFLWDCPKCNARNSLNLEGSEPVEIRCPNCNWDVEGQRVRNGNGKDKPPTAETP